jgi:Big-like domain-containing protein
MVQQTVGPRGLRRAVGVVAAVAVATVVAGAPVARGADATWTKVASGTTGGISGLAPAASGWVVVRDNKLAGQDRVALLSEDGAVTELAWPGTAPQDLESIAAVPGDSGEYAALTSSGQGSLISLPGSTVSVDGRFTVPRGTQNIESLALTQVGTTTVALWATRGSTTTPANVYAATFTPATGVFGAVSTTKVSVPYPTSDLRQVSDLTVVDGRLVGASSSDPGVSGPFDSALYDLGSVTVAAGRAVFSGAAPQLLGTYPGHKVEGIACSGDVGLLGSDDEKLGGWIRSESFCGEGDPTPPPDTDTTPPTVTATSPADGATGAPRTGPLTATFSEPVSGVGSATMTLRKVSTGARFGAVVGYDASSSTATLTPNRTLPRATEFSVTLGSGVADAAGNPLAATSWSFTTGG